MGGLRTSFWRAARSDTIALGHYRARTLLCHGRRKGATALQERLASCLIRMSRNGMPPLEVEASGEDPPPNGWQTDPDLHQLPEFQELNRYILAASNGVLNFIEVDYEEMQITGCWANISPKGGDHPAHQHPNNFLSGVYYVSVPKGSGIITFHDPRSQAHIISPKVKRVNFYNASTIDVEVREGLMCLFPGWLIHSVPRNPSEERRISVSFNINFAHFTERVSPPLWRANMRSRI